jgi:hypothetical protein
VVVVAGGGAGGSGGATVVVVAVVLVLGASTVVVVLYYLFGKIAVVCMDWYMTKLAPCAVFTAVSVPLRSPSFFSQ